MTRIRELYHSQFVRFIFVGILNTALGYGVFALFFFFDFSYPISLTASSIVGILHSYAWNKYFTFKASVVSLLEFLRFISVYIVIYIVNLFLLVLFVDLLEWHELLAQAVILFFVTVSSFLGHKYWSFELG